MVYQLKCYKLPEAAPQSLGKAMVNILPIEDQIWLTTASAPAPAPPAKTGYDYMNANQPTEAQVMWDRRRSSHPKILVDDVLGLAPRRASPRPEPSPRARAIHPAQDEGRRR